MSKSCEVSFLVLLYSICSLMALLQGASGANNTYNRRWEKTPRCLTTPVRCEPLFPAYKLGCYMFSEKGDAYYYGGNGDE